MIINSHKLGAGELAQYLRAPAVLLKGLSSVPSKHVRWLTACWKLQFQRI